MVLNVFIFFPTRSQSSEKVTDKQLTLNSPEKLKKIIVFFADQKVASPKVKAVFLKTTVFKFSLLIARSPGIFFFSIFTEDATIPTLDEFTFHT